ncbi:MAG TPA: M23 family metallopeptidase [Nevskia sp.]|nr:M23 family metallopeptidase [Nevskia sp.]
MHALAFERPRGLFFLIGLCAALSLPARAAQGPEPGPLLRLSARLGAAGPAPAPAAPAAALTAPIPGAPVSSPFGWRMHPILKVRRFHNGVDYAAPAGTPVHAAGDGVIESMGREPRFGRMLRIRHDGEIETAYSHLARFAPGLKVGSVVSAGEVIGTVGHSGWATGPHLDYEVIVDGRSVDPASLKNRPALRLLPTERLLAPTPVLEVALHDNSALGAP